MKVVMMKAYPATTNTSVLSCFFGLFVDKNDAAMDSSASFLGGKMLQKAT